VLFYDVRPGVAWQVVLDSCMDTVLVRSGTIERYQRSKVGLSYVASVGM
jgi:hypothetical protein